ncbi:hypothetical protein [Neptuniibacter halophilus]|uniref:hypothetical protein n=1 Tax=Neptuniibacter halophilus TaxID=651666 RepID=UPI002572D72F|nr:hypothetical protein [Neptuniibacter halophilus]
MKKTDTPSMARPVRMKYLRNELTVPTEYRQLRRSAINPVLLHRQGSQHSGIARGLTIR